MPDISFVITLIADPEVAPLSQRFVDTMAGLLAAQGIGPKKIDWLAEGAACDLYVQHGNWEILDVIAQDMVRGQLIDAVVQPVANRRKKLLIADMESTIITCECLDELAELVGIHDKIAAITARAMNGELDFEAALKERVGLLKDLPESALRRVMDEKVRLMPGARELVSAMKKNGAYAMLVSGGFDFYAEAIAKQLGFDEFRANKLEIKNAKLTGTVIPPILDKDAKLRALTETCKKLNIDIAETVAVGDGANDLPMLLAAGLGVAYHAKPVVRAQAKARINHGDLRALLWAQGF